jgi:hypothetical protein
VEAACERIEAALALRPGFIAGVEFHPEAAPWLDIVSVKKRGNYLIQRSQLQPVRKAHERPSGGVGHATKAVGRPASNFQPGEASELFCTDYQFCIC